MDRQIIHVDLDAFFCAVEELKDPSLRGKPFAVGGSPEGRGVITSASYAARQYGVRSAMPTGRALRLCPQLILARSKYSNYSEKSKEVRDILREFSEQVQPISIDEAFLDVSGGSKPGEVYAREMQARILKECGLPSSFGIATNKLVAKIATNVGKAARPTKTYPNAIQVVPPGEEASFLAPLPSEALWGVGPKTAEKLAGIGIHTIGEIAAYPQANLRRLFGQHGEDLARRARGIDARPVSISRGVKSISQENTFAKDVNEEAKLLETIRRQSKSVSRRLKKAELTGMTVKIKLRWPDFTTITRQITLESPTDDQEVIYSNAKSLLERNWRRNRPVRLIGVGVSHLEPPSRQLSLWDAPRYARSEQLNEAVESLRKKYGQDAITLGNKGVD